MTSALQPYQSQFVSLACWGAGSEAAMNIVYNIIGGLLTIPCWVGAKWSWEKWRKRRFKRVFGPGRKSFVLCYGSLVSDTPTNAPGESRFNFAKPSSPALRYSATKVASGCEVRGSAYLASELESRGCGARVADDESQGDKLDIDFVSLGYSNNCKTQDLVSNDGNLFATFDLKVRAYVTRSGRPLYFPTPGWDYGIIVRIHPTQFPGRTWICCAGYGEWGTSGCAWFLARKWTELSSRLSDDQAFLAIVKVKTGQDESATLVGLFKTLQDLDEFAAAATDGPVMMVEPLQE